MTFLDSDLGFQQGGTRVQFILRGSEANVMLLDQGNFQSYRAGRQFHYTGGHTKTSPVVLAVPHAGHWHAVVDLGGGAGTVNASVTVLD